MIEELAKTWSVFMWFMWQLCSIWNALAALLIGRKDIWPSEILQKCFKLWLYSSDSNSDKL